MNTVFFICWTDLNQNLFIKITSEQWAKSMLYVFLIWNYTTYFRSTSFGFFFIVLFLLLLFWCFWFFFLSHTPFIICYSTGLEFKTNVRNKSKNLSLLILVLLYIIKIRTISIVWFYCSRHLSISYDLYFFHSILLGC